VKIIFFIILFITSCSHLQQNRKPDEGKRSFLYLDVSGKFKLQREHKSLDGKLISRSVMSYYEDKNKILEKSIIVSQLGTIKTGEYRSLILRPLASDYVVWLEGKKNEVKMRLDEKNKALKLIQITAEGESTSSIPFISGSDFCFYNQLAECLYHNNLLIKSFETPGKEYPFVVIWDSYPLIQDLMSGMGKKVFSPATVKYEGLKGAENSFQVEVEGQVIIYQFSKSFDLVRMLWILQGISILPPNEEPGELEE
jgi:hypothetical protein